MQDVVEKIDTGIVNRLRGQNVMLERLNARICTPVIIDHNR